MSFPRYPKYKPSGVEWLGDVPEDWMLPAVGHRYDVALGKMLDGKQITGKHLAPYLRNADVQWGQIRVDDLPEMDFEPADRDRYALQHGDLLVCEGGEVGRCAIWHSQLGECYYQKALHRLRPLSTQTDHVPYMRWLLEAAADRGCFSAGESKATIAHLPAEALRRTRIPCPGLSEQRAIAAFLDRETAKIDALIAEQEKLIELLAEKRQAVISHAVTKGLNPAAPMKPSGIEWLGDVPAHWDLVRLGYRGSLQNGLSIGADAFGMGDPFVSYGDVYKNAVLPEVPSGLVLSTPQDQDKYSVEVGDVLFTRTSESTDDIGVASTCLRTIPRATFAGFLIRFRPQREVLVAQYAVYLFRNQAVARHFAGTMNIVTRASLSQGELRSLPICIPPPGEQRTIAVFLDREIAKFDALVREAENGIGLLRERRSALISAAVTGQIDVRNAVPENAA